MRAHTRRNPSGFTIYRFTIYNWAYLKRLTCRSSLPFGAGGFFHLPFTIWDCSKRFDCQLLLPFGVGGFSHLQFNDLQFTIVAVRHTALDAISPARQTDCTTSLRACEAIQIYTKLLDCFVVPPRNDEWRQPAFCAVADQARNDDVFRATSNRICNAIVGNISICNAKNRIKNPNTRNCRITNAARRSSPSYRKNKPNAQRHCEPAKQSRHTKNGWIASSYLLAKTSGDHHRFFYCPKRETINHIFN